MLILLHNLYEIKNDSLWFIIYAKLENEQRDTRARLAALFSS